MNAVFKKTIFISLLGHMAVFSIFNLTFGRRIPKAEYVSVSFLGQLLLSSQVIRPIIGKDSLINVPVSDIRHSLRFFVGKPGIIPLAPDNKITQEPPWKTLGYLKPQPPPVLNTEKKVFIEKPSPLLFSLKRKEPMIIFHPLLPYDFTLYFKDRQVAHVELMFNIVSTGTDSSTLIKRKISSGNLEVDLLTMRHIGHYLFIQKKRFTPNNWQAVKIDLSAKD